MTISVSSYVLKTAEFTEEQIKSILSYSVGFNPRVVKMELMKTEYAHQSLVKLEEKRLDMFARSEETNEKIISDDNVRYVTGQLDSWAGSGSSGNAMSERAALLIRALAEKVKSLENEGK